MVNGLLGFEAFSSPSGFGGRAGELLDAARKVGVALSRLDGMSGDPDRLQARRAEPVDAQARNADGETGEYAGGAGDGETGLAALGDVAADDVGDLDGVQLGHLLEGGVEDGRHQLVGTDVDELALVGSPDR